MSKKKNKVVKKSVDVGEDKVRTLILDIESRPASAFVWSLLDVNISLNQIIESGNIICWAAKWAGEDVTYFSSVKMTDRKSMLQAIWDMLNDADEVVGWNSNAFDLKMLNAEFLEHGMTPPSPYKKIDLMRVVKSNMKFLSHKLDYVSRRIGIGQKTEHQGFPLWVGCMKNDSACWKLMETYNLTDVELTEELYFKLLPWISTGVNRSSINGLHVCPNCGSKKLQARGSYRTTTSVKQRFSCSDCGTWSSGEKLSDSKPVLRLAK